MKIDWKRKLTGRKLWVAVAGFVAGLILAFGGGKGIAETVTGCIMSGASVVGYILGEGLTDAAALNASRTLAQLPQKGGTDAAPQRATGNKDGDNNGADDN